MGVNSILSALTILDKHFKIKKGAITIALDCESALKTCPPNNHICVQMPSFDVLQDIRNRLAMLPITVTWRWVERYQKKRGKKMNWWARNNFGMDLGVKFFLKKWQRKEQPFLPVQLFYKHWAVYYDNIKQLCINPKKFYKQIFHKRTRSY